MTIYYKATRPNGTDFYSGTIDYAAALASGEPVTAPGPECDSYEVCTPSVLHASEVPTETLIGGSWPCRLFEVEGVSVATGDRRKHGFRSLRVVREVDAHMALGPQGPQIVALIGRARELTGEEVRDLNAARDAAWDAARNAAWNAAGDAAGCAARDAAWDAARYAARYAAAALVVRDLIGQHGFTQAHYDTLTRPWRTVIGPIHPDDEEL